MTRAVWVLLGLGLACVLAGLAFAVWAPRVFPAQGAGAAEVVR